VGCINGRRRMPDAGCRIQDAGYKMPDAGCRMPDAGCRMPDAGCKMQDARYSNLMVFEERFHSPSKCRAIY